MDTQGPRYRCARYVRAMVVSAAAMAGMARVAPAQVFTTGFEPPVYAGTPAGVPITGQDSWVVPVAGSVDGLVMTYAGNVFGLPPNGPGKSQFLGQRSNGGAAAARSERLGMTFPDVVTIYYDACASYNGVLPAAQNLGSFSLQPVPNPAAPTIRTYIQLNTWVDVATATNWSAGFLAYDAVGTQFPASQFAGPAWQNLVVNHWYRFGTTVDFVQNRIVEVSIIDLSTGVSVTANPQGWFLGGGAKSALPRPTGVRCFAGGAAGNIMGWDNLDIAQPMRILGFTPPAGGEGEIITIVGSGFGNNPDNICAVVMNGHEAIPLRVIDISPNGMRVEVRNVDAEDMPGPIMIGRGTGEAGTFVPLFRDVIPESPTGTWVWNRNIEPMALSEQLFVPIFRPPPPPIRWYRGRVENGRLCVFIDGDWMPNSYVRVIARAHNHQMHMGADLEAFCIRFRAGGSAEHCAHRICDVIACAFRQRGIDVNCVVLPTPDPGRWKIEVIKKGRNGEPVPIDWGTLRICVQMPRKLFLPSDFFVTPFFGATISHPGPKPGPVLVSDLGPSNEDGVTINVGEATGGVLIEIRPIDLDLPMRMLHLSAWGSFNTIGDTFLGDARLWGRPESCLDAAADFSNLGSENTRVQVFNGDQMVGEVVMPNGNVGVVQNLPGLPLPFIDCWGKLIPRPPVPPCFFINFGGQFVFTPSGGPPFPPGNSLRMLAADAEGSIDFVTQIDQALGAPAGTQPLELLINNATIMGDKPVCPCNFNSDAVLNSQDFFDFLSCFFTPACLRADYNADGVVNSQDFFDFLGCFFEPPAGCN